MNQHVVLRGQTSGTAAGEVSGFALGTLIARIEEAVTSETAALRSDPNFDVKASNERKSRYLYELTRATRNVSTQSSDPALQPALESLRTALEANERAVLAHMEAVKEVAGLVQDAIRNADTDGTYSASGFERNMV